MSIIVQTNDKETTQCGLISGRWSIQVKPGEAAPSEFDVADAVRAHYYAKEGTVVALYHENGFAITSDLPWSGTFLITHYGGIAL
jgi:hypothetical protein